MLVNIHVISVNPLGPPLQYVDGGTVGIGVAMSEVRGHFFLKADFRSTIAWSVDIRQVLADDLVPCGADFKGSGEYAEL